MAKGNLPNTNTQATGNSMGLNNMQSTGNQAPWQQMANQNVSYPSSIVQQGNLGPFGTNNFPMNNPMGGGGGMQGGLFNRLMQPMPKPGGMGNYSGGTMDKNGMNAQAGLNPSPEIMNQFMPKAGEMVNNGWGGQMPFNPDFKGMT